jgi:hypothetical protein
LVVAAACVFVTVPPVLAQPPVRIAGVVQWVSSTSMAVMSNHGDSIMIDLMEADQSRIGAFELEIGSSSTARLRPTDVT